MLTRSVFTMIPSNEMTVLAAGRRFSEFETPGVHELEMPKGYFALIANFLVSAR